MKHKQSLDKSLTYFIGQLDKAIDIAAKYGNHEDVKDYDKIRLLLMKARDLSRGKMDKIRQEVRAAGLGKP